MTTETAHIEAKIVATLVRSLLISDSRLTISVSDGEALVVKHSRDTAVIFAALQSTDSDILIVHRSADDGLKPRMASILLIWGNGWDVISDYSTSLEGLVAPAIRIAHTLQDLSFADAASYHYHG